MPCKGRSRLGVTEQRDRNYVIFDPVDVHVPALLYGRAAGEGEVGPGVEAVPVVEGVESHTIGLDPHHGHGHARPVYCTATWSGYRTWHPGWRSLSLITLIYKEKVSRITSYEI